MTVTFELPDYCAGCMQMELAASTEKQYANNEIVEVKNNIHCIHAEKCDNLLKYHLIRFAQ